MVATETLIETLRGLPLFAVLPEDAVVELAGRFERQHLAEGEVLLRQGDPSDTLYIIESGRVNIVLVKPDGTEQVLNEVQPGGVLGQMTFVDGEPRTAGAVTLAPTEVLALRRADFLEVVSKLPAETMEAMRTISGQLRLKYLDILKRIALFDGLPDQAIAQIADHLQRVTLEPNEVLFRMGDMGDALYIIEGGWVKIVTLNAQGEELVVNQLGPGQTVGEMSIIDHAPRSASVVALTRAELLRLDRASFMHVIRDYPEISLDIMRQLSRRMRFNITYIRQAIDLSRRIAEGDYSFVMDQLETSRSSITGEGLSDEALIAELLSAFFTMVKGVREREETLKQQVQQLTIQIDEARRRQEVESLTETDFFTSLQSTARRLREEDEEADGE